VSPAGWTILVVGLIWTQAVAAVNLVVNPGFEEGPRGGLASDVRSLPRPSTEAGRPADGPVTGPRRGRAPAVDAGRMEAGKTYTVWAVDEAPRGRTGRRVATMQQVDDRAPGTRGSPRPRDTRMWTSIEGSHP